MTSVSDERASVINYLHQQLIGPLDGPSEKLYEQPTDRYMTGILYPIRQPDPNTLELYSTADEPDGIDDVRETSQDSEDEEPITLASQLRPSSAGQTFVTSKFGPVIVDLAYGRYQGSTNNWTRRQVCESGIELTPSDDYRCVKKVESEVTLEARWRPFGEGAMVTVVVVNRAPQPPRRGIDPGACLFQVELKCKPRDGQILRYPDRTRWHRDDEAEEIRLQYRDVPVYAIGHGVAMRWDDQAEEPQWVGTTFLPTHKVPDVSFDVELSSPVLSMLHLSRIENDPDSVIEDLLSFGDQYDQWVSDSRKTAEEMDTFQDAALRLVDRMEMVSTRVHHGIQLLMDNKLARRAFARANLAMLMQVTHSRSDLAGTEHAQSAAPQMPTDYMESKAKWRPFQLAYLLLTIKGVVEEDSKERSLVDLIWFPTGGGKTEAYLGLAAFTILHRRLLDPYETPGTTVITRYTLRLLTTQQFQRASTMVLACERIREQYPDELGTTRFSIGIWVGKNSTPNRYSEARKLLNNIKQGAEETKSFQVDRCPWCGTRLIPDEDPGDEWGIDVTNSSIRFWCLNADCDFADGIPISSVDDDLYENPPTLLVSTVDKFARLAWEPRAGVFLGAGEAPGPSLIIQDEFHLISGPLGTLVGLYEAAFDVAMQHHGARPKLVAATATIRRAAEQTRGVFGREVRLFPPAGLTAGESFFVHTDHSRPGRQYLGVMPQGHTPVRGMVMLAAAMLQAPCELPRLSPEVADGYWTVLAYHNSLRELGKTITLSHDDIGSRIQSIASGPGNIRQLDNVGELTSRIPPVQIPRILDNLGIARGQREAMSLVAATNMISVGVDVSRLGVMIVNGQPKTTAEYIQATSRVGRDSTHRPGIVLTLYSPGKPRDRSHYESFIPYHSMLYSSVEPTSVTPFSVMARRRALHADLVILVRHALGLSSNEAAADIQTGDPELIELMERFIQRAVVSDPEEEERVRRHLTDLLRQWERFADLADADGGLVYKGSEKERRLLKRYMDSGKAWPTLDSMRNVDRMLPVIVYGAK